jgi:hypothetical protein
MESIRSWNKNRTRTRIAKELEFVKQQEAESNQAARFQQQSQLIKQQNLEIEQQKHELDLLRQQLEQQKEWEHQRQVEHESQMQELEQTCINWRLCLRETKPFFIGQLEVEENGEFVAKMIQAGLVDLPLLNTFLSGSSTNKEKVEVLLAGIEWYGTRFRITKTCNLSKIRILFSVAAGRILRSFSKYSRSSTCNEEKSLWRKWKPF